MIKNRAFRYVLMTIWLQLVISLIFIGCGLGISLLFAKRSPEVLASTALKESGQAVIDNHISSLFTQNVTDLAAETHFYDYPPGSEVYVKDQNYYIASPDRKNKPVRINPEYPFLSKEGQVLFLYHNLFQLITEEVEIISSEAGTYVSQNKLYNLTGEHINEQKIILIKLPNGLYMNTTELVIESGSVNQTIGRYSVISLQEDEIAYCSMVDTRPKVQSIELLDSMTILRFGEKSFSYDGLYIKINRTDAQGEVKFKPIIIEEDIYQYFLGNRYDYKGVKEIYYSNEGYFCKTGESRFLLPETPIYYAGEKKLLLPCDNVVIQPRLYLMNKLPALSQVTYADGIIYTKTEELLGTYVNMIVFNGADLYLFFDETIITLGKESITLPPLSYVIVTEEGNVECYNYDTGEYQAYYIESRNTILAEVAGEIKFNLSNDILYRMDGQEQILFSDPSLLMNLR